MNPPKSTLMVNWWKYAGYYLFFTSLWILILANSEQYNRVVNLVFYITAGSLAYRLSKRKEVQDEENV
jgi:hypothetical protein